MADIWNKYESTAARTRGKPGRQTRPKSLTLDMHAHAMVPRAGEIAAPHLKAATDPLVQLSTPETQALMAKQHADIQEGIRPTELRFRTMDDMGVDMQLISPGPPQIYYTVPLEIGVQSTRA